MKYCEYLQNSGAPLSAIDLYEKNELKKVYKLNKGIKESQTVEKSDKKIKENVEPKKYQDYMNDKAGLVNRMKNEFSEFK